MDIVCSPLYEEQLKSILESIALHNFAEAKKFKLYLDTIIINMPTKYQKYKQSIYFNDENIKDIEHEGYTIVFYIDKNKENYLILGIIEKK